MVITTYNRSDALLAVLRGLTQQTDKNFEVIVADDGSRPEQQQIWMNTDIVRALRVVHVWHPDVGFTASRIRNRGVAVASGNYLIFMDGDCVPEVDFIARHKALAQTGHFINGSRILLSETFTQRVLNGQETISGRSIAYWIQQYRQGNANKPLGWLRLPSGQRGLLHWARSQREFSWKRIRSCNLSLWRSDFERVDGFDESFIGWGHEDADFVLRLHHAGLVRKNGFFATEVFHLWHKEAARNQESHNARIVRERALSTITQPALGYAQERHNDDAVITRLG